MLSVNQRLSAPETGLVVIDIPSRSRLVPGFLAAAFLGGILVSAVQGVPLFASFHLFPLILAILCTIGALYHERWIFDGRQGRMTREVGLVFACIRHVVDYSTVRDLVMSGVLVLVPAAPRVTGDRTKAEPTTSWRSHITLNLATLTGRRYRIDQSRGKRAGELEKIGRSIAERTDLPLTNRVAYDKRLRGAKPG